MTNANKTTSIPWGGNGHGQASPPPEGFDLLKLLNQFLKVVTTLFIIAEHVVTGTSRR